MVITNLDIDEFNKRFVEQCYPCMIITKPNDPLVLTLNILIKGDMPLLVEHGGSKVELMRIDVSAFNVAFLLDVVDELIYVDESNKPHTITCTKDYLEVLI